MQISGLEGVIRDLTKIGSKDVLVRMNREIGFACAECIGDHIAKEVSPSHHKVADRLKAVHTGFFEFARGRQGEFTAKNHDGFVNSKDATENGVSVVIGNTPGMSRAFHPLDIKPKNRYPWLTIPIHKDSYGKRVKDLRKVRPELRVFQVTTKKGKELLLGTEGHGKTRNTRPLYALVKSVTVPQDRGLLPTEEKLIEAAVEAAEAFRDVEML